MRIRCIIIVKCRIIRPLSCSPQEQGYKSKQKTSGSGRLFIFITVIIQTLILTLHRVTLLPSTIMTQVRTATRTHTNIMNNNKSTRSSVPRQYRNNIHLCILFMDQSSKSSPSRSTSVSSSNSSTPSIPYSESNQSTPHDITSRNRKYSISPNPSSSLHAIHQSQYLRNLMVFMRDPKQHNIISYDAKVLATAIFIWCAINLLFLCFSADSEEIEDINHSMKQREDSINKLILFLITILIVHKDVILCNGQSSLPLLLLFNFTVKMSFEFLLSFTMSLESMNTMLILLILSFCTQRFTMDLFSPNPNGLNVTRSLIRSHLFYRGPWIRWISFVLYSWFSSLLILDLMDVLCIAEGDHIPFGRDQRAVFIINDAVIVGYSVICISVWNGMKAIDLKQFKHSWFTLYVPEKLGTEICVFSGFVIRYCPGWWSKMWCCRLA